MIKVSVIIPVYKTEKYLRKCLESVLSQTLIDIEAVCINDGSPDGSLGILREFEAKDSRVKVIDKKNEGVGAARNDGIRTAQGEYVNFMDSDDFYPDNGVLMRLYDTAKSSEVEACGGYYRNVDENGENPVDRPRGSGDIAPELFGVHSYSEYQYDYGFAAFIFDRKMLVDNNIYFPHYSRFQDPPFFVKAMIAADRFYAIGEATYCYRQLPSSAKTSLSKTTDFLLGLMDNLRVSREYNLAQLHALTAKRLDAEGSYMAIHNMFDDKNIELYSRFIQATGIVDTDWLKSQGIEFDEPYLPELFRYTIELAEKYEKLRQSKPVRLASKVRGLFRK